MGRKHACCAKYKRKGKACKKCPVVSALKKKQRKKFLKQYA